NSAPGLQEIPKAVDISRQRERGQGGGRAPRGIPGGPNCFPLSPGPGGPQGLAWLFFFARGGPEASGSQPFCGDHNIPLPWRIQSIMAGGRTMRGMRILGLALAAVAIPACDGGGGDGNSSQVAATIGQVPD